MACAGASTNSPAATSSAAFFIGSPPAPAQCTKKGCYTIPSRLNRPGPLYPQKTERAGSPVLSSAGSITGDLAMADLGALLWPRTVALIGASAEPESLRGRIFNVMRGHRFAGTLYPVSRSSAEVGGVKAYPSVADLPEPADLAVIIIPAEHVPAELERCGKAGVRAAVILSSGFAEASGSAGSSLQQEIRAIAGRYDMAVSGPNSEGFANVAAGLCPTFSPAMEASGRPLTPVGRERRQL